MWEMISALMEAWCLVEEQMQIKSENMNILFIFYFLFFFKHEHFNGTVITKMTSMYSI